MEKKKKLNRRKILYFWFFFSCSVLPLSAQSLHVQIVLNPVLSPYLSDWIEGREQVQVLITNGGSTAVSAVMKVKIYLDDLLQAETDPTKLPPVTIPPGTHSYRAQEFLTLEAVDFYGNIRQQVQRTGKLPSGRYRFCFQLLDPQMFQPITPLPEYCQFFQVIQYEPIVLLSPANGDTIRSLSMLRFQWTPIAPPVPQPIRYRLLLYEVLEGQNPIDAYRTNPPVIDYTVLNQTVVVYQPELGLLVPGRRYIWSVQVTDDNGRPLFDPDGRAEPFQFFYAAESTEEPGPGITTVPPPSGSDTATVATILFLRIGPFTIRLADTISCSSRSCLVSGTGTIAVPFLGDSIVVSFTNLQVQITDTPAVARVIGGIVAASGAWILELFAPYSGFSVQISRWEFSPSNAVISGSLFFDGTAWDLPCVVTTENFDRVPVTPDSLQLILPITWSCSGGELAIGDCFSFQFDTLQIRIHSEDGGNTVTALTAGQVTIYCWTVQGNPVSARFQAYFEPGQLALLTTVHIPLRKAQVGSSPIWLTLDSLILDVSSRENHPRFPPFGSCNSTAWSNPLWKGIWIPSASVAVRVEEDTLQLRATDIVLEQLGSDFAVSFSGSANFVPPKTITFAGFKIRIDSTRIALCQGTIQQFYAKGMLQLPASLQKPAEWAALDSIGVELNGQRQADRFLWLGSLDLYGAINLPLPPTTPMAALRLQNGRIAKVGVNRGYVEFTTLEFQLPPNDPRAVLTVGGLRIWNDGRVEFATAEGWITVSSWARLQLSGLTIQASEIGIGYEGGHWWAGISGGFEIAAASGLSGGRNGIQLRRLKIFDDGRMQSSGAHVNFAISNAVRISGTLFWGEVSYGSVATQGMAGQLNARFDCFSGAQGGVNFAFGRTRDSDSIRFWYLKGELAFPGGVPIVPGAFHLVGGIVGAGWHVRLDNFSKERITTSGFSPVPPIVPDETIALLLRGGLIFADASLQTYLFRLTTGLAMGQSFQLDISGDVDILPAVDLASGTLNAQYNYTSGAQVLSLAGGVTINFFDIRSISAGFSATFTPSDPCLQVGPLQRRWILFHMDEEYGSDLLGVDVVARAYLDIRTLSLRFCLSSGQFVGSVAGAGVAGAVLHVGGVGDVPFHVGLGFDAQLCLRYALLLQNRANDFWARGKMGAFLDVTMNFDYSGWLSLSGWKGTQAWDHIYDFPSPPVDISRHWCGGSKCKSGSVQLKFGGVLQVELSVPKITVQIAGKQISYPNWFGATPSIQYGYYVYGRLGDREWAKEGGNNNDLRWQAQNWSCSNFESEANNWAGQNKGQQQPPEFLRASDPADGFAEVDPANPKITLIFGAPIASGCSGGSGVRCWYIDQGSLQFQLQEMENDRNTIRENIVLATAYRRDSAFLNPQRQFRTASFSRALRPNTWYRLVLSGYLRSPDPVANIFRRDTIWFKTAAEFFDARLWVSVYNAGGQEGRIGRTIGSFQTHKQISHFNVTLVDRDWLFPYTFGQDLGIQMVNLYTGRTYHWAGRTKPPVVDTNIVTIFGYPVGMEWALDTAYFQPVVVNGDADERIDGNTRQWRIHPGLYRFRLVKRGTAANFDHQLYLDALPQPVAEWFVRKLPYGAQDTVFNLGISWVQQPRLTQEYVRVRLLNRSDGTVLYPGTPVAFLVRKVYIRGEKRGETVEVYPIDIPNALLPGQSLDLPVRIGYGDLVRGESDEELIGIQIRLVSQTSEFTIVGNPCIEFGESSSQPCSHRGGEAEEER